MQPCVVLSARCTDTHIHTNQNCPFILFFYFCTEGLVSLSPRSRPRQRQAAWPLHCSRAVLLRSVLIFTINSPSSPNLFSLLAPSPSTYCYASHLTCRHSAAVPLHPPGLCSSILVKHTCVCVCTCACVCFVRVLSGPPAGPAAWPSLILVST